MRDFFKFKLNKFILTSILFVTPFLLNYISFANKISFGHQLDKILEFTKLVILLPGLAVVMITYPNDKAPSFIASAPSFILFFVLNAVYLYFFSCLVLWVYNKLSNKNENL